MKVRRMYPEEAPTGLYETHSSTVRTVVIPDNGQTTAILRRLAHEEEWCDEFSEHIGLAVDATSTEGLAFALAHCMCPIPRWPLALVAGVVVVEVDADQDEEHPLWQSVCGGGCEFEVDHFHILRGHPDGVDAWVIGEGIECWPEIQVTP